MGCESLKLLNVAAHSKFSDPMKDGGMIFLSYYMKTMHARSIALREDKVMAFSFQPGGVETPGVARAGLNIEMTKEVCTELPYVNCLCGKNVSCPLDIFQGA